MAEAPQLQQLWIRLADAAGHQELIRLLSIFHSQAVPIHSLYFDHTADGPALSATVHTTKQRMSRLLRSCSNMVYVLEATALENPVRSRPDYDLNHPHEVHDVRGGHTRYHPMTATTR